MNVSDILQRCAEKIRRGEKLPPDDILLLWYAVEAIIKDAGYDGMNDIDFFCDGLDAMKERKQKE